MTFAEPSESRAGSMKQNGPVKRADGGEQPEALVVKGVEIQGAITGYHMSLQSITESVTEECCSEVLQALSINFVNSLNIVFSHMADRD